MRLGYVVPEDGLQSGFPRFPLDGLSGEVGAAGIDPLLIHRILPIGPTGIAIRIAFGEVKRSEDLPFRGKASADVTEEEPQLPMGSMREDRVRQDEVELTTGRSGIEIEVGDEYGALGTGNDLGLCAAQRGFDEPLVGFNPNIVVCVQPLDEKEAGAEAAATNFKDMAVRCGAFTKDDVRLGASGYLIGGYEFLGIVVSPLPRNPTPNRVGLFFDKSAHSPPLIVHRPDYGACPDL